MYTEIVKIIEGGIAGDKEKVYNYANVLAKNLENEGDIQFSKKIKSVLSNKRTGMATLDSLVAKPVDIESRLDMVEITYPQIQRTDIVLNGFVEEEINDFVNCYIKRDDILKAGLETSNSLLLYGPPGCGKTMVAKYISSITGLPLVTARLDGMISSLLGSTAKNIRKIFDYAAKSECILFLDEFDVIAKLRDDKNELGELKRVVNSLIQNIDSLSTNSILIAATNHHELLDPAIWRRFSKAMCLEKPQKAEVNAMLEMLLKDVKTTFRDNDKKYEYIQNSFLGLSNSDIKTIVQNCVKQTIINGRDETSNCDILREIYFYKNHSMEDEERFIKYLLTFGVTHKELNDYFNIPLRKIQKISKGE